ncbi:MAG: AbrB/MazE/SpoVT family DNA-binding domain-containing protein [Candidatus Woesearchaeota archaeon]
MGTEIIEIGSISSRGQIAIPTEIRKELDLKEGSKVIFFVEDDMVIMKKVTSETFAQITKPLREARKKIKEEEVTEVAHKLRKA